MNPIPENIRRQANDLAKRLQSALPNNIGFALLLFDFGPGGTMSYISNGNREDMMAALRELLDNMEKDNGINPRKKSRN
jgi:hypothetical protein